MKENTHQFYDYINSSEAEINRLHTQAGILHSFEQPVFERIISPMTNPVVVDIGCNDAAASMKRLEGFDIEKYIGIDISHTAIATAQNKYENTHTRFFCKDITDEDFSSFLSDVLENQNADIIIVSLVLLHLENPLKLLSVLSHHLKAGAGRIIVKDIDDRNNKSSADPGEIFKKAYEITYRTPYSGNRHTGRNIGNWLSKNGYKNVRIETDGLSTKDMSLSERSALYETYFGFFEEDCEASVKNKCYDNAENDLLWCRKNLPVIRRLIETGEVEFSLGFVIYSATV